MAFVRIVSGKFERDMNVLDTRSGERMRLGNSQRLFARERETVDDAFAGDVVGLVGNYDLLIGDTLATAPGVTFPRDPPFRAGVFRLSAQQEHGQIQALPRRSPATPQGRCRQQFQLQSARPPAPLFGAVGPLQFEVLQYRLEGEYAAETRMESATWSLARWLRPREGDPLAPEARPSMSLGAALARDSNGWLVALLPSEWALKTFSDKNDGWIISDQPFPPPTAGT